MAYSVIYDAFWTGATGRRLFEAGKDAQLIGLYLCSCPSANMIGLYYLPLPLLTHHIRVTRQGASKGLRCLSDASFAFYDDDTEMVWIPEMLHFQTGGRLAEKDKRRVAIQKLARKHYKHRFYTLFFDRYFDPFKLEIPKPLRSPFDGASMPLRIKNEVRSKKGSGSGSESGSGSGSEPLPLPETSPDKRAATLFGPLRGWPDELTELWAEYQQHRIQKRERLTEIAAKRAMGKLYRIGTARAIAALKHSIENGWTGIHEPGSNGAKPKVSQAGARHQESDPFAPESWVKLNLECLEARARAYGDQRSEAERGHLSKLRAGKRLEPTT